MWCRTARRWGVAAADAQLSPRRQQALDRHLEGCEACRQEQVEIERVLRAVDHFAQATPTAVPPRLERAVLSQVRARAQEATAADRRAAWPRRMVPAVASGVVGVAALWLVGSDAGRSGTEPPNAQPPARRPDRVARSKPSVPPTPPPALLSDPELFVDLTLLRNLDKLQHFDAIATVDPSPEDPPADPGATDNG